MHCEDKEKKLKEKGVECSAVVSIHDFLILLGSPLKDNSEENIDNREKDNEI